MSTALVTVPSVVKFSNGARSCCAWWGPELDDRDGMMAMVLVRCPGEPSCHCRRQRRVLRKLTPHHVFMSVISGGYDAPSQLVTISV